MMPTNPEQDIQTLHSMLHDVMKELHEQRAEFRAFQDKVLEQFASIQRDNQTMMQMLQGISTRLDCQSPGGVADQGHAISR